MLRLIASIVGGLVIAFAIVFATDTLFHALLPSAGAMPADPSDRAAMGAYVASQPPAALFAILLGWTIAAFVGAFVAARFAERGPWPGWIVGGLFLLATAANFVLIPHPAWMVIAGVLLILIAAWAGSRVGARSSRVAGSVPA